MIHPTLTPLNACVKLAEGNPGAAQVCALILRADPDWGYCTLLDLDDMGLRGSAIWVAYKDYAKQDLPTLVRALKERSPELIAAMQSAGYQATQGGQS